MLYTFNEKFHENLRLDGFSGTEEAHVLDVRLDDKVWMSKYKPDPDLFQVIGLSNEENGCAASLAFHALSTTTTMTTTFAPPPTALQLAIN